MALANPPLPPPLFLIILTSILILISHTGTSQVICCGSVKSHLIGAITINSNFIWTSNRQPKTSVRSVSLCLSFAFCLFPLSVSALIQNLNKLYLKKKMKYTILFKF
jgi:hypothetical protein